MQENWYSGFLYVHVEEELYYPSSKNKGANQLCSYCTADLRLCFCIGRIWLSHGGAHFTLQIAIVLKKL